MGKAITNHPYLHSFHGRLPIFLFFIIIIFTFLPILSIVFTTIAYHHHQHHHNLHLHHHHHHHHHQQQRQQHEGSKAESKADPHTTSPHTFFFCCFFHDLLHFLWLLKRYHIAAACWLLAAACVVHRFFFVSSRRLRFYPRPVYVLDFACYKPRDELKCNYEVSEFMTRSNAHRFSLPSMDFQRKIFERSGLGDETYLPAGLVFKDLNPRAGWNAENAAARNAAAKNTADQTLNPSRPSVAQGSGVRSDGGGGGGEMPSFEDARAEAEEVLFGSVAELLLKCNVKAEDIAIVVSNCSLHCPSPSYASMLVSKFKLNQDVKAFHLAGMGCSASLIAVKLAADLLRVRSRSRSWSRSWSNRKKSPGYALVVSTENITLNYYFGNEKPMLVTNCLFRVGCAAILLSDSPSDRPRSKYRLLHCVRTHRASDDDAYGCAYQTHDPAGLLGVSLNKNLMRVAADALRTNVRSLAPLVLPVREQLRFVSTLLAREILKLKLKQYVPDFKPAIRHFCLHAGGRAVIDEIQKNLHLDDYLLEPSRATLHRWGNTSASCVWYVLAYMECQGRVKAGDKVWMLGLGSGFKCNSAILEAVSDVPASSTLNAWADCIHRYPAAYKRPPTKTF